MELKSKIDQMFADYVSANGNEPQYARCTVMYLDDKTTFDCAISLTGSIENDKDDDNAFFYVDSLNDLRGLTEEGCEEFIITDCIEFYSL